MPKKFEITSNKYPGSSISNDNISGISFMQNPTNSSMDDDIIILREMHAADLFYNEIQNTKNKVSGSEVPLFSKFSSREDGNLTLNSVDKEIPSLYVSTCDFYGSITKEISDPIFTENFVISSRWSDDDSKYVYFVKRVLGNDLNKYKEAIGSFDYSIKGNIRGSAKSQDGRYSILLQSGLTNKNDGTKNNILKFSRVPESIYGGLEDANIETSIKIAPSIEDTNIDIIDGAESAGVETEIRDTKSDRDDGVCIHINSNMLHLDDSCSRIKDIFSLYEPDAVEENFMFIHAPNKSDHPKKKSKQKQKIDCSCTSPNLHIKIVSHKNSKLIDVWRFRMIDWSKLYRPKCKEQIFTSMIKHKSG